MREPLFQHRMVSEVSVVLTRQHGDIFPGDEIESDVFDRDALELRINSDEIESARFACYNVVQVAVRFCANHEWQIRNQRVFLDGNAATAVRFKSFRDEPHGVSGIGKALQLQFEFRVPVIIGFFLPQLD